MRDNLIPKAMKRIRELIKDLGKIIIENKKTNKEFFKELENLFGCICQECNKRYRVDFIFVDLLPK